MVLTIAVGMIALGLFGCAIFWRSMWVLESKDDKKYWIARAWTLGTGTLGLFSIVYLLSELNQMFISKCILLVLMMYHIGAMIKGAAFCRVSMTANLTQLGNEGRARMLTGFWLYYVTTMVYFMIK